MHVYVEYRKAYFTAVIFNVLGCKFHDNGKKTKQT